MMTLQELRDLRAGLTGLIAAGEALRKAGLVPVFDLTPGRGARILTDLGMPGAADAALPRGVVTGDVGPVPCDAGRLPAVEYAGVTSAEAAAARALAAAIPPDAGAPADASSAPSPAKGRLRKKTPEKSPSAAPAPVPYVPGPRQAVAEIPKVLPQAPPRAEPAEPRERQERGAPDAEVLSETTADVARRIEVLGHPYPFSALLDLDLVTGVARGDGSARVAEDLGLTKDQVIARYRALMGLSPGEQASIDGQVRLLKLLRERAERAAPPTGSGAAA